MLGVGYLSEDENGFLCMLNQYVEVNRQFKSIELLNFNEITLNDFYSFLKYYRVTNYVIVCNGDRIRRLVDFFNCHFPIKIHLFNEQLELLADTSGLLRSHHKERLSLSKNDQVKTKPETPSIKNELYLLLTGHYPLNLRENLIKHLYVETPELINVIHPSVLKNVAINGIVFINNGEIDTTTNLFPILIDYRMQVPLIKFLNLSQMSKCEIEERVEEFQNNGNVLNSNANKGIIDYSVVMNIDRNNRLFYSKNGIYRDFNQAHLITNELDAHFYRIVNSLSFKNTNKITPLMRVFPITLDISAMLERKQMYIVTPFNSFYCKERIQKHKDLMLIGLIEGDQHYVYDIRSNLKYKVHRTFLILLEFYLKDKMDSFEIEKYIPDRIEVIKNQFYQAIAKIS